MATFSSFWFMILFLVCRSLMLSAMPVASKTGIGQISFEGRVLNIFHEPVDSVKVTINCNGLEAMAYTADDGTFKIPLSGIGNVPDGCQISFARYDYQPYDTIIGLISPEGVKSLEVHLVPRYKIQVRGRTIVTTSPLEGVDVTLTYQSSIAKTRTLGCYIDEENYWNCLYLGMFRHEIVTDDPSDTVLLAFHKRGYKPQFTRFPFANYTGEVMRVRMRYASQIDDLPQNLVSLKLGVPLKQQYRWGFIVGYHHHIKGIVQGRLTPGWEFSSLAYHNQSRYQGTGMPEPAEIDTVYFSFCTGPSVQVFLTRPETRYFSTYAGAALVYMTDMKQLMAQPYLGTRVFLDMRKAMNIEFRYMEYPLKVDMFQPDGAGSFDVVSTQRIIQRWMINLGLQICF